MLFIFQAQRLLHDLFFHHISCCCIFFFFGGCSSWCSVCWRSCCITITHIQLYTYTCGNKINNNDERTDFFRKIYLSHFIRNGCERVVKRSYVRDELETEQSATYWPPVPLSLAALLLRSAGLLNWGSLRAHSPLLGAGSLYSILSPTNWFLSVAPGHIVVWCPSASCGRHICTQFNTSTVKVIPWYLRPDAPVVYTGASLFLTARPKTNILQSHVQRFGKNDSSMKGLDSRGQTRLWGLEREK